MSGWITVTEVGTGVEMRLNPAQVASLYAGDGLTTVLTGGQFIHVVDDFHMLTALVEGAEPEPPCHCWYDGPPCPRHPEVAEPPSLPDRCGYPHNVDGQTVMPPCDLPPGHDGEHVSCCGSRYDIGDRHVITCTRPRDHSGVHANGAVVGVTWMGK